MSKHLILLLHRKVYRCSQQACNWRSGRRPSRSRLVFLSGILLLGALVACQSQTPETTPSKPTPLATLVPTAMSVAAPTPEPTAVASPAPKDTPSPTPKVARAKPSPTPTQPWQIPEIQPDDWAKGGGADAGLTLVEYSDFQ